MWQGQKARALDDNLQRLTTDLDRPAVLMLQEAGRDRRWSLPGYDVVRADERFGEDFDNCAILVRSDGQILDRGAWQVEGGEWIWNGNRRAPRTWPWVVARFGETVLVAIAVHQVPNGPDPSIRQNARAWRAGQELLAIRVPALARQYPGAVTVVGGDWNSPLDKAPEHPASMRRLVDALGATPRMKHIDGFLVIEGRSKRAVKLEDRYGSDGHRPVRTAVTSA